MDIIKTVNNSLKHTSKPSFVDKLAQANRSLKAKKPASKKSSQPASKPIKVMASVSWAFEDILASISALPTLAIQDQAKAEQQAATLCRRLIEIRH